VWVDSPARTVLAHPGSSYVMVGFLAICVTAMVHWPIALVLYVIPIAVAVYIRRTATIVGEDGLTARALFGSSTVSWDALTGLRLDNSGSVYAVDAAGTQLKLPCVRATRLNPLIQASHGRIPDPAQA
jgi:Bacterial PH domain